MKVTPEELYKQFSALALPVNDATNVVSIDGTCHKLGKTKDGYPDSTFARMAKRGIRKVHHWRTLMSTTIRHVQFVRMV